MGIENAGGLVAAALGKKSNRKKFYDKVFIKLLNDFYKSNSSVEKRLSRYKEACEKFKKQYELVKNLQEKLDGFGELSVNRIIEKRANNKVIMKNELQLEKKEEERFRLETELSGLCIEIKQEEDKLKGIDSEKREEEESVQRLKCECEKLENQLNEIRKSKESVESSIGFFMKFFKTGGYKSKMECIEAYGTKEDSLEHEIIGIQTRKEKSEENLSSITEAYEGKIKKISELNEHKKTKEGKYRDLIDSIGKMTEEISDARQAIAKKHLEYEKEMCVFQKIIGDGSGIILDQDYVQNLFYEEQCISAQAHVGNPWATEQYNREREKLFYYAMKLNKEFGSFFKRMQG